MQSCIRPRYGARYARPGHHEYPRTESQSMEMPLKGQAGYRLGPTFGVMNAVSLRKRDGGSVESDVRVELALVFLSGPADAGCFVGQRTGGFVVAHPRFECAGPLLEARESFPCPLELLGPGQDRASAVGK